MKRRDFLRTAGMAGAVAPVAYNGLSIHPLSEKSFFARLGGAIAQSDKIMVFIELNGGNDGLNTLIPLDQYSNLYLHRPKLMIPANQVLPLSGVNGTGLHPAMSGLREMFDNGLVSMVQNVGYPNQDYSHFRSMDIWMSASDSNVQVETGWLGRMLERDNPIYPDGYPNPDKPDPLAIQIGVTAPLSLMGSTFPMGISVNNPTEIYDLINDYIEPAPPTPYGDELNYIRTVMQTSKVYTEVIKEAATIGQNLSALYPNEGDNELADQLKVVARLINGGLSTQVYLVSIGGFDTHSEQVVEGEPTVGNHAELLRKVSEAIYAFYNDIELMGKADKVCGMTYSEFGRTIGGNESFGSDHGAAAPLFVFGKGVNPGIIGSNPQIGIDPGVSADIPMANDFRQVYASVLQDWFGQGNTDELLYSQFTTLPIFKDAVPVKETLNRREFFQVRNFPNPVQTATTIAFTIPAGYVVISLMDAQGRVLRTLAEGNYAAGTHQVLVPRQDLHSGTYFYQVRLNGIAVTRKMMVM
jgi:uncharacterized protein (DUF1501 family)